MAAFGDNDLVLTADLPFTRTLTFTENEAAGSWANFDPRLQVRHLWDDSLLIELTAFLEPQDDPTRLLLSIPATLSGKLPREGRWDLLAIDRADPEHTLRMPRPPGRFLVLPGVTRRE